MLLRGKTLELEQVCDAWRSVQRQEQEREEQHRCIVGERDSIVSLLQAALHCRMQEVQVRDLVGFCVVMVPSVLSVQASASPLP